MSLEGRRSIQLSYGRILGCALILLELEHQFDKLLLTANESDSVLVCVLSFIPAASIPHPI
jgi:hypothetical protein